MIGERVKAIAWGLIFGLGVTLAWNRGQLPARSAVAAATTTDGTPPDLALYRDVIAEVRGGRDYYEVAREKIPQYGFPISSPLNWRLPTYAWLLSRLPAERWIQAALVVLSAFALTLVFVAKGRESKEDAAGTVLPSLNALVTTCLMFGVVKWSIDGQAYLAQEPWAAVLITISLAAMALAVGWDKAAQRPTAHRAPNGKGWAGATYGRWSHPTMWSAISVLAGIAALMFRELALPWCVAAAGMAVWKRRWSEAAVWVAGIAAFFAFFAWHVAQVKAQLAGNEVAASAGLSQWFRLGGLDFVLLTTRMNGLLFSAPGWLLWLYVLNALVGLSRGRDQASHTACLAALMYMLAFAVVGRPENFYWGLMPAPLLAWGAADSFTFQVPRFKLAMTKLKLAT